MNSSSTSCAAQRSRCTNPGVPLPPTALNWPLSWGPACIFPIWTASSEFSSSCPSSPSSPHSSNEEIASSEEHQKTPAVYNSLSVSSFLQLSAIMISNMMQTARSIYFHDQLRSIKNGAWKYALTSLSTGHGCSNNPFVFMWFLFENLKKWNTISVKYLSNP